MTFASALGKKTDASFYTFTHKGKPISGLDVAVSCDACILSVLFTFLTRSSFFLFSKPQRDLDASDDSDAGDAAIDERIVSEHHFGGFTISQFSL